MTTPPAAVRSAATSHTLTGTWRSELGSELELHNTDGFLSGRYRSAVGTVQASRPLIGFCTPPTGTGTAVLGFVVCWSETGSVTSWTGRYDSDTDRLHLTWVLEGATTPQTAWRATQLGQDQFRRAARPPPARPSAASTN
ncbi:MAG TPA: avidin/streptavidin family protein [Acidimicrobiales bacterium]|nr:avidin/streptavidin family protein [Acidimicrobiales bacterium]